MVMMDRFERWCHDCLRDARYGGRALFASPGFTATVVLSLALGIGANTAIFSILHALVLRSLPVSDPERLVVVTRNQVSTPYPLFRYFRERSQTLVGVLAFRTAPMRLEVDGVTERVTGALVSGSYFDVLGVEPVLGSAIADGDDVAPGTGGSRGPVAVLSHGAWMRRFGGQSSVLGSRILINGQSFTVVGIAPRGFKGSEVGESPDVFAPMMMQPVLLPALGTALSQRQSNWIRIDGTPGSECRRSASGGRAHVALAGVQPGHPREPGCREVRAGLPAECSQSEDHPRSWAMPESLSCASSIRSRCGCS